MVTAAGQSPRLWGLVVQEVWRRTRQRLRTAPAYRWRYAGRTPERVLIAPPDLRLADPQIASEIYHGRFALAGKVVETGGRSPFAIDHASPIWREALHEFRWLRHLREAGTDLAAANGRALVSDWIDTHGAHIAGTAWEPAITAKRVI
ncbi:MAG: heparinase, partial [Nitratireductor sp.]